MKSEEEQLVEDCRKNKKDAFRVLYERFAPQMFGICLRYSPSREIAEDVLHDGFIKVFETIHSLRDSSSLSGWIRSIMIYTAINSWRHRMPTIDNDNDDLPIPDASSRPELVYSGMDIDLILGAIQQLPETYRMVFNLCEIEGYSFAEVAEKLGISQSSVRSNLSRAKHILQTRLASFVDAKDE